MLLWVGFALMTAAVTAALLRPLWRSSSAAVAPGEADLAVYRHQLNEIEADRDRGLIAPAEAESARTEIARRMLARADAADHEPAAAAASQAASTAQRLATLGAVFVPLASVALYLVVGSPRTPDAPLAARLNVPIEQATVEELIGRVEARLAARPDDAKGWEVVAPIYARSGRYADAANAYARQIALAGESMPRLIGLAETTVLANNGLVTDLARKAFARILQIDPTRTEAAFGLALAKEQDGDLNAALADYRQLLAGAPADANWKPSLVDRIKALEERVAGRTPAEPAPPRETSGARPGPSAADIAKMAPDERDKTILAMVERLAQRLKDDGKDLPGWVRLARAYTVLGRQEEAAAALAEARRNFAGDDKALGEIDALEKSLKQGE